MTEDGLGRAASRHVNSSNGCGAEAIDFGINLALDVAFGGLIRVGLGLARIARTERALRGLAGSYATVNEGLVAASGGFHAGAFGIALGTAGTSIRMAVPTAPSLSRGMSAYGDGAPIYDASRALPIVGTVLRLGELGRCVLAL